MDRAFNGLLAALNAFASLWILFLVFLISVDVIGRGVFNWPVPGVPEIVRLSIVAVFWLQVAYTLRIGSHLRTTMLLDRMSEPARRTVLVLNAVFGTLLFAAIAYWAFFDAVRAWETDEFEGEHPVRIPTWPLWWSLVIGATLTSIQYLILAYAGARYGYMDREDQNFSAGRV
jgi:TRAP-type mannitol/chloroaromatic compound transport system permease small subunit